MQKSFISNQRGFSLFEIVMALGMMSLLSLGVMRINQMSSKGQKTLEQKTNRSSFQMELLAIFTNKEACVNTLAGLNPNGTPGAQVTAIRSKNDINGASRELYLPGANIGEGSSGYLVLRDIYIGRYNADTGVAYLTVNLAKPLNNAQNSFGGDTVAFSVPLKVQLDGTGAIENCFTAQDEYLSAMCESLDGIWDENLSKCRSIKLETASTTEYSISATQGMQVNEGLYVGPDGVAPNANGGIGINTAPTGEGNLNMTGDLTTGGNATISGNASVTGNADIGGDAAVAGNATVVGDATVRGVINLGPGSATISADATDVTISTNLRTSNITTSMCGTNEVAILRGNGQGLTCIPAANLCANTATELRVFDGFNSDETVRCRTIMKANSCGAGQAIKDIILAANAPAEVNCCTPGCTKAVTDLYCPNEPVYSDKAVCPAVCPTPGTKPKTANAWTASAGTTCKGECSRAGTNSGIIYEFCKEGDCGGSGGCEAGAVRDGSCTFECELKTSALSRSSNGSWQANRTIDSIRLIAIGGGGGGGGGSDWEPGISANGQGGEGGLAGDYKVQDWDITTFSDINYITSCSYIVGKGGLGGKGGYSSNQDPGEKGGTTEITCYTSKGTSISLVAYGGPGGRYIKGRNDGGSSGQNGFFVKYPRENIPDSGGRATNSDCTAGKPYGAGGGGGNDSGTNCGDPANRIDYGTACGCKGSTGAIRIEYRYLDRI